MKIKHPAIIALSALAALIFAPSAFSANAHGSGSGMHSFHFGKHFRHSRHNNRFNQWAPYGGVYAIAAHTELPVHQRDCDRAGRRRRDARRYSHTLLSESVQPFINPQRRSASF